MAKPKKPLRRSRDSVPRLPGQAGAKSAQLQPRVYVVMDAKCKRPQEFITVDLSDRSLNLMIKKCLKAGSYGIEF